MSEVRYEDRRVHLAIKIGSLADEARRIRKREVRACRAARLTSTGRKALRCITIEEGNKILRLRRNLQETDYRTNPIRRDARNARKSVYEIHRPPWRDRNLRLARDLALHRVRVVRSEARYSQLALAFIRGVPYRAVESSTRRGNEPAPRRVKDLVLRFGGIVGPRGRYYVGGVCERGVQILADEVRAWLWAGGRAGGPTLAIAAESQTGADAGGENSGIPTVEIPPVTL